MMNFELDAKIDSYRTFFFFLASGLGGILESSWKKSWFDGDVDRNALIPNVLVIGCV